MSLFKGMTTHGELALRRFDPKAMKYSSVSLLIAKRGSGKSVLLRDILYNKRRSLDMGIVFCPTEVMDPFFKNFIPPAFIYSKFDVKVLWKVIARQAELCKKGKARDIYIILDDCGFDKKTMNSEVMRWILQNGRHAKLFVIINMQYVTDLHPSLRSNIDYVFCLQENLYREKLYKNFFSMVPSMAMFNSMMDKVTENYGCLVLDNNSKSNTLTERLFHYRANPDIKPFRLGPPSIWAMSREYKDDHDEPFGEPGPTKKVASVKIKTV